MKEKIEDKSFNLVDEPWIPVAGSEPASLRDVFARPDLTALGGNPRQKIALLKLLLAIAQAAATPATADEWSKLKPDGLADACLAYLDKWRDRFDLYGEKPFLQMPVGAAELTSMGSLRPEIALGNNPRLTHIQCDRDLSDAEKALVLVTEMSMCLGGKRGDKSVSLAKGLVKRTAPPGPGVGFMGFLHNFLTGNSIRETVWLNLLTENDVAKLTPLTGGVGVPPWEQTPETERCPVAEKLKFSLQGRLVPMARFCLLDGDGARFTEGVAHKGYKEGLWDPSVAANESGKDIKVLWADPEKRPWRSLSSLLAFLSASLEKGNFECFQLKTGVERLEQTDIQEFGVWSGGLRVSSNSGQQYISGNDDMVESETRLSMDLIHNAEWFPRFSLEMEWLEAVAKILFGRVAGYFASLGAEGGALAAQATGVFWEKAEELLNDLIEASADKELLPATRRAFVNLALECYDDACARVSAKQLGAWARNRPRISANPDAAIPGKGGKNEGKERYASKKSRSALDGQVSLLE